jgi:hypothetical protein
VPDDAQTGADLPARRFELIEQGAQRVGRVGGHVASIAVCLPDGLPAWDAGMFWAGG